MKAYKWYGTNRFGHALEGIMWAKTAHDIRQSLARQSILVKTVRLPFGWRSQRLSLIETALVMRQLMLLMTAGVSLVHALGMIRQQQKKAKVTQFIQSLMCDLENGASIAEAFQNQLIHVGRFICQLIMLGEQSGTLNQIFKQVVTHLETRVMYQKKLKERLRYPTMVLILSLVITFGLLLWVVPQFERLFSELGTTLPMATRIVITGSDWMIDKGYLLLIGSVMLFFAGRRIYRVFPTVKSYCDRWVLTIPMVKHLIQDIILTKVHEMLAVTYSVGYPVMNAMSLIAQSISNQSYRDAMHQVERALSQGYGLEKALQVNPLFPSMMSQLIAVGEASGTVNTVLFHLATYYHQKSLESIRLLECYLEPVIMVGLGLMVGGIALSMYLPILTLGTVV